MSPNWLHCIMQAKRKNLLCQFAFMINSNYSHNKPPKVDMYIKLRHVTSLVRTS